MTEAVAANWFAVQTAPRAEQKAAVHLLRQGFGIYLPRYLKRRRHARRVEQVAAPFFPGYLFVSIDVTQQRWRSINSTIGVTRLVCNGDMPAIVDDRIVDALKSRESEAGFIEFDQSPRFHPGDKIRVLDGAFTAIAGLYESRSDRERVTILLDLLGRKVRVTLHQDQLAAA